MFHFIKKLIYDYFCIINCFVAICQKDQILT